MLTRSDLIAAVGETVPAWANTPARRVSYTLSVLAYGSVQDPEIKAAAKSCYDGSISRLASRKAKVGDVVDYVLARAMVAGLAAAETIGEEETAWLPTPDEEAEWYTLDQATGALRPMTTEELATMAADFRQPEPDGTPARESKALRRVARQQRLHRKAVLLRLREQDAWDDWMACGGDAA